MKNGNNNINKQQNNAQGYPIYDPKKFEWKEMFSSEQTGKTSVILFVSGQSSITTTVLIIALVVLCATKVIEATIVLSLIEYVLTYYGISVGLLGVRSITSSFGGNKVTVSNVTNSDGSRTMTQTIKRREYFGANDSSILEEDMIDVPQAGAGDEGEDK